MIDKAIEKIRREIEEETEEATKMLGQQTIDIIEATGDYGQVLQADKSLEGCQKAMDDYASKHRGKGRTVIGPQQAEEIIKNYYGIQKGLTPAAAPG
ncbi:MAG: hypothetical protein SOR93_14140, partial [Clostridiales Family XIII bacterium]|nr:hypothetical protein [Clostridia bacterium]MDY3012378.1 hypothetical protein [Clostridiales Family XIII bacterium]